MKKIYFAGLTTLLVGGAAIAQNSEITFKGKMSREEGFNRTRTTVAPSFAKAPNDTIWFDDFSAGDGLLLVKGRTQQEIGPLLLQCLLP